MICYNITIKFPVSKIGPSDEISILSMVQEEAEKMQEKICSHKEISSHQLPTVEIKENT